MQVSFSLFTMFNVIVVCTHSIVSFITNHVSLSVLACGWRLLQVLRQKSSCIQIFITQNVPATKSQTSQCWDVFRRRLRHGTMVFSKENVPATKSQTPHDLEHFSCLSLLQLIVFGTVCVLPTHPHRQQPSPLPQHNAPPPPPQNNIRAKATKIRHWGTFQGRQNQ